MPPPGLFFMCRNFTQRNDPEPWGVTLLWLRFQSGRLDEVRNVPVAFDFQFGHDNKFFVVFTAVCRIPPEATLANGKIGI